MQTLDGVDPGHIFRNFIKILNLSEFLQSCFKLSSRKDQLVGLVRESLDEHLWSSYLSELGRRSDEEKFQVLVVLVAIIHPENQVTVAFFQLDPAEAVVLQYETFSPANQSFLMQLRTLCDSVIHTYLVKIADTAEKRNYLHVIYTAVDCAFQVMGPDLGVSPTQISRILASDPSTFQLCGNPDVFIHAIYFSTGQHKQHKQHLTNYIRDFLWNPERSRLFHCDPGLWSPVVAVRFMRYLTTLFHSQASW